MKKLIFLFSLMHTIAFSEEVPIIRAKYQETLKDRHIARGEVSVELGETRIFSDELEYNFEKKTIAAKGNVIVDMPGQSISAKEILLNLDDKTGEMKDVFIMNEQGLFLRADYLKRESEKVYRLKNSILTSCTQPNPRWSIHSKNIKLKKDDYVDIWGGEFKIKSLPVFYLPYLRYPLPKEGRKTGFLMPQIGSSDIRGYTLSSAFFWAIGRSTDLTLYGEYFSKWGGGLGTEFRWRTAGGFRNAKIYNFFYKEEGKKSDYHINLNLREELPKNLLLTAEANRQSTFNFFTQFMNDFNLSSQSFTSSSINISKTIGLYSIFIRLDRNESIFGGISSITSRTPQIKFSRLNSRLFAFPVFFSFDSSIENFSRKDPKGSISFPYIYFSPSISTNLSPTPWLSISEDISWRFDFFGKSYNTLEKDYSDKSISKNFVISRFSIVGPSFYRIFQSKDLKMKHVIEPRIVYFLSSRQKISEYSTPFGTGKDLRVNQLDLVLSNKILKKKSKQSASEFLVFNIFQSFYYDPEEVRKYSDIGASLRVVLTPVSFTEFRTSYDPERKGILSSFLSLNYLSSTGTHLRISWSKERRAEGKTIKTHSDQVRFFTSFKIPSISIDFTGETNYDFKLNKMLGSSIRIGYTYQCINFSIDYLYFPFRFEKKETQVRFNIGFANIGVAQDMLGGRGF
ncbi:MAG: LPS-assembly protein LptD [Candidatus Aminicenantia bacterium]